MFKKEKLKEFNCRYNLNDGSAILVVIGAKNRRKAQSIAISKMRFRRNVRLGNFIIPKRNITSVTIEDSSTTMIESLNLIRGQKREACFEETIKEK